MKLNKLTDSQASVNDYEDIGDGKSGPPDRYKLAYWICLLLGVAALFPWNAFITAADYFGLLYKDIKFPFIQVLPVFYNWPNLIFFVLNIRFGPNFSQRGRIILGLLLEVIVFVLIPVMDYTHVEIRTNMWVTLGLAIVCGMCTAILFGTILGLVAMLPPAYTTAVMSGNGIAGIIVGVIRIVTKVTLEKDPRLSALIYFALTGFVIFLAVIGVNILVNLPFTKWHMAKGSTDEEARPLINGDIVAQLKPEVSKWSVMKKIWLEAVETFYVFFVTLALFPGLTFLIPASSPQTLDQSWVGIILVAIFQVLDYVGRQLPQFTMFIGRSYLWIFAAIRTGFFPLFILCVKPLIFQNNWIAFAIMFVFALTNGYFGTLGMIYGPSRVEDHEKEVAGTIMGFFLQGGIFFGVHFSFLLLWYANEDALLSIFYPK